MTEKKRPKVFIVNHYAHDFSKAAHFGDLVSITEGRVNFLRHHEVIVKATEKIRAESSEEDFLLLSGHNLLCSICVAVWLQVHPHVRLLVYDTPNKKYVIRDLTLSHIDCKLQEINGGENVEAEETNGGGSVGC